MGVTRLLHVNMSLLRVCAFAKCLNRRNLFEKCTFGASFADCCQLCVSIRNGAVRRISGEPKDTECLRYCQGVLGDFCLVSSQTLVFIVIVLTF